MPDPPSLKLRTAGNTRPPRTPYQDDQQPNLGTRALMNAIDDLARTKVLVGARIAYKRNARREHVVALIFSSFEQK